MTQPTDPLAKPVSPPVMPGKRGRLVRVSDVNPERIDWLWPGHLARGMLHDVTGDPGLGKSTVTTDLAASITNGKPWPDGQPGGDPAGVVLISVEDGVAHTIRPRLDAAGADTTRVVVLTEVETTDEHGDVTERLPELPTDVDIIRDAINKVGAALVVIDPLMACLAAGINAHRDQDVRRALSPLIRVAETTGTAILTVRHLNKGDSDNAMYRGGGSIGMVAAARIGYTVGRHPDEPDNTSRAVIAGVKSNICPLPVSIAYTLHYNESTDCAQVHWDGEVPYTANNLLRPQRTEPKQLDPTAQWLTDYLTEHHGAAASEDIRAAAEQAGIAERTLRRAAQRAGIVKEHVGMPAHTIWRLPDTPQSGHATQDAAGLAEVAGLAEQAPPAPAEPQSGHPS